MEEKHLNELLDYVKEDTGVAKKDAEKVIKSAMKMIVETLESGGSVTLYEFGKFAVKDIPERLAYSIAENRKMIVPAHKRPAFTFARAIKEKCK